MCTTEINMLIMKWNKVSNQHNRIRNICSRKNVSRSNVFSQFVNIVGRNNYVVIIFPQCLLENKKSRIKVKSYCLYSFRDILCAKFWTWIKYVLKKFYLEKKFLRCEKYFLSHICPTCHELLVSHGRKNWILFSIQ